MFIRKDISLVKLQLCSYTMSIRVFISYISQLFFFFIKYSLKDIVKSSIILNEKLDKTDDQDQIKRNITNYTKVSTIEKL